MERPLSPRRLLLLAAGAAALLSPAASAQAPSAPAVRHGIDLAGMDRQVKPGDQFYTYANGDWMKTTVIPPDRSSWGDGSVIADIVDGRVAELIRNAGAAPASDAGARKVADFYAAYMDEAAIEAKGLAPARPELARIAAISDRRALSAYLGSTVRADVDMLNDSNNNHTANVLGLWVAADLDQPTRYSPFLVQGGLSLPSRDYYLDASPRMALVRQAFQGHVARVLALGGSADPQAQAAAVVALETAIARTHASATDVEDPAKGDNHWSRADLAAKAPGLDWGAFLAAAGLGAQPRFTVWTPGALTGESALAASQPLDAWKAFLTFHLLDAYSNVLPKAFVDARFDLYGRTLGGAQVIRPRTRRAITADNAALGEEIGRLYAARWFPASDKAAVQAMVADIKAAFGRRIDALDWMAPATKREAHAKLDALIVGVGYPDKWRSYAGYRVARDDAFGNAWRASLFQTRTKLAWLARPVDRAEWVMTPQTVNAVNLPVLNGLNFPAAYLQPPNFDPAQTAAVNYGSIGAVIGHEISHSFDNTGALFDSRGRLRDWWTKADFAHFDASAQGLARQYDAYCPFPDLCVRGEQTLGENIADLAGLTAAHDAWRTSLHGAAAPVSEGLSGEQQFFLSFAQTWRSKVREPALRAQILSNGHAPSEYRALTVRNLDAWYPAFDVIAGQSLHLAPDARVRVW